jgi:hypothetical protein
VLTCGGIIFPYGDGGQYQLHMVWIRRKQYDTSANRSQGRVPYIRCHADGLISRVSLCRAVCQRSPLSFGPWVPTSRPKGGATFVSPRDGCWFDGNPFRAGERNRGADGDGYTL